MKTYHVGTHKKCLVEAHLMSTTTYIFVEKQERYQYFSDAKSTLSVVIVFFWLQPTLLAHKQNVVSDQGLGPVVQS